MNGNIKELWMIIECPYCNRPNTKIKHIDNNAMVANTMRISCDFCFKTFPASLDTLPIDHIKVSE